jgi:NADPH:quinone reductase-like Zn-dependent oxidoreductase
VRAAGILEYRGPVHLLELPAPELAAARHVLIEVAAAGVGNWDEIVRTGGWDVGGRPPMALGVEAAGVVRAVGTGVSRLQIGDAVLTFTVPRRQGAWAELFAAPEEDIAPQPPGMGFPLAGLFPVPALTAHAVFAHAVALQPGVGEHVLIHGAGGVTGGVLVAVAAALGARVIATAGPQSADRVRGYGASVVVDYHRPDWPTAVRDLTGGGVSVAVNAVRGAALSLMRLVVDGGCLATITGDPPAAERQIRVSNCYVRPDGLALEQLAASFTARGLAIPVAGIFGLAQAGTALAEVIAGTAEGGVLIDPRR